MEKMPQCMSTKDAKYGSWVAKYANCIFAKIESSFAAKGWEISSCQFSSNDVCFPMLSRNVRISALTLSFHTFSEIFLRRQRSQFLPPRLCLEWSVNEITDLSFRSLPPYRVNACGGCLYPTPSSRPRFFSDLFHPLFSPEIFDETYFPHSTVRNFLSLLFE